MRAEERLPGDNIHVDAGAFVIPVFVAERRLSSLMLGHLVLLRRELLSQFRIRTLAEL
jgi:hypothetical protein